VNAQRELAESAQRQSVLAHELQHRMNNMLAMIRAVARRGRARYATVHEFVEAFDNRLGAIARVHNLLARPEETAISIRAILMQELAAYGAVEGQPPRKSRSRAD
jgi:two-component sensor histidine kinase